MAEKPIEMKVSKKTDPKRLAGAIAHHLSQQKTVLIKAVGRDAQFEADKSIAIARGILVSGNKDLRMYPSFFQVGERDGISYSGICYTVFAVDKE